MTEYQNVSITVENNTTAIATIKDLTAEQEKKLLELQKFAPGDISISPGGVVSITSQKGLALFNSFCRENNILDSSSNALMLIDMPEGSSLPLEGLKSASAFCASFGRGGTAPSQMSFTELMTLMLMMTYSSEEDRKRALAEVKVTQNQIALDVAVDTWETSREAAEKSHSMETFQAWGTIASGIASGAIAVGSSAYSFSAARKQSAVEKNNDQIDRCKLLQERNNLQDQLKLQDTKPNTIDAKRAEVQTAITEKEKLIEAKQQAIKSEQMHREEGDNKPTRQQQIDANQKEIDAKNDQIKKNNEKIEAIDTNDKEIKANEQAIKDNQDKISAKTTETDEARRKEEANRTPEEKAKLKELEKLTQEQEKLGNQKAELLNKREDLKGDADSIGAKRKVLQDANTQLEQDKAQLEEAKAKLAEPITKLVGEKAEFERELEGFKDQEEKLARLEMVNKKIEAEVKDKHIGEDEAKRTPEQPKKLEDKIKGLENKNEKLQTEIKTFDTRSGTLTGLGQSVSGVMDGFFKLLAAGYKREAAFLEADVRLLDTFRGVIQSQTQGIDSSINSANQNMQKIASNLKQVLDEAYSTMSGIIRNI
jgi:hypothetical protein